MFPPLRRMSPSVADPSLRLRLLRFGVRALRISASTVAVVAFLRQQWLPGACFALVWVLVVAAPGLFPQLESNPASDQQQSSDQS